MSSEVCPFCGKTYKRLKSHLPHCKAAGSSKTPPTKHDVAANQTSSSSQLATALSEPKAEEKKSTQTLPVTTSLQSEKSTKTPSVSSVPANTSSLSKSTSPSSVLPSSSTKKKKEKLSEQIKTANIVSSTSLSSSPPLSPTSNISEPKRKSLRALIEAAKSKQVSLGSGEGTRSASEDLPSASDPLGTDPLNSRTKIQTETKTTDKALVKDTSHPVFLSKGSKPKGASKMKATRTKKAIPSLLTINETSLDSKVNDGTAKSRLRDGFWVEKDEEVMDISVSKTLTAFGCWSVSLILGALTERSLGQVRLRELPEWLACRSPSHPRDVVHMVQRGWQWYYRRYIDVRKGGVGGVGMLLAGYCVLSYIWSYPHIKRDRWRKHH
ncbi:uncharacterized protein LKV04_020434 [Tautogolabrus adspersus]